MIEETTQLQYKLEFWKRTAIENYTELKCLEVEMKVLNVKINLLMEEIKQNMEVENADKS